MIEVFSSVVRPRVEEAVFFSFDDHSIPVRSGVTHHLLSGKVGHYSAPLAIENGPPGSHDEMIFYYGTVLEIDGRYHLWYCGQKGDPRSSFLEEQFLFGQGRRPAAAHPGQPPRQGAGTRDTGKLCYATSEDGIHWTKPDLGLVEFNGSKKNNLCEFPLDWQLLALAIVHDPNDPDESTRYKMLYEAGHFGNRAAVAYSADGQRWTQSPDNPVATMFEHTGLVNYHGCYFAAGQVGYKCNDFPGRAWSTMFSYDFTTWNHGGIHALKRPGGEIYPDLGRGAIAREQVHLGAALHHRGNVILGIYGQWHHPPTNDRRQVACDLGLAISTDALHYHEPVPDFRFIGAEEEPQTPYGLGPALSQGQGMIHVGDETRYFYGAWPAGGHIRTAIWGRDRFGYLQPIPPERGGRCITCPFHLHGDGASVFLNVDGVGDRAELVVVLLDERCEPVAGFTVEDAVPTRAPGYRAAVRWRDHDRIPMGGPHRLQISWRGVRNDEARLYAVYIEEC